jgi:hypothetical protein
MSQPAAAETAPVTVLLRLECRGRRGSHDEWYQVQVQKALDATIEDFKPYVLEKTSEQFGSVMVKRTHLFVEQWDPVERHLLVSYSLPASKASDFGFELWYGYGFKQLPAPVATAR